MNMYVIAQIMNVIESNAAWHKEVMTVGPGGSPAYFKKVEKLVVAAARIAKVKPTEEEKTECICMFYDRALLNEEGL